MKYIITLILSCWLVASAQITAEQNYSGTLYNVKLNNGDIKNLLINYTANTLSLYNIDHSLYKTITVPVPSGYSIYYVNIVADKLFNFDADIETAITFSKSDSTGTYYIGRVIEENGTILLDVADCYSFTAVGKSTSYKLHSFQAKLANSAYTYSTNVYGVPGSVSTINPDDGEKYNILSNSYPNPSNGAICINFTLPANLTSADLQLFNSAGQLISVHKLNSPAGNYLLPTANLATGVYFYQIKSGQTCGKFNKLTILK